MADQTTNELPAGNPIGQRVNTGVVFMGAAWYSGSTLLGVMLGAHPSIFYAGEAKTTWYFDDPVSYNHLTLPTIYFV